MGKILTIIIIIGIVVWAFIKIDNKHSSVYKDNMSAEAYQKVHNVLNNTEDAAKKSYDVAKKGVGASREQILDLMYKDARGTFVKPLSGYYITSDFGFRFHPVYFFPEKHRGIDLACKEGSVIIACNSGIVTTVGEKSKNGMYVRVQHANGYSSAYLHLSSYCVKANQKVRKGQMIGKSGNTGTSTGPHLHFAIKKDNAYINPEHIINL